MLLTSLNISLNSPNEVYVYNNYIKSTHVIHKNSTILEVLMRYIKTQ